ncbi:MAG: ribosome biogenesis GTPase Der [Candidatus Hydrogenedentes bacterium]|nr:ribosome biogenesis GTPase Der [Candidatus Hydrogenedentota bacterium]
MARRRTAPLVAICGRPNVGKSTLFNRIIGRQSAIVHAEEGITRDRAYGKGEWNGRPFRIVDTGGIVENPTDPITHEIQSQVRAALEEATVIVFVVDGQQEITRGDEEIRDALFRTGRPVVLAVNKLDNPKLELNRTDFYALGLGDPHGIAATHNLGIADLMDAIAEHLPPPAPEPDRPEEDETDSETAPELLTKVAVIGKPNVGKSSFINAILNEERNIVTEIPGTTRDAIDIEFQWQGRDYLLIDTAGMRKKGTIRRHVERFSVSRALRSVRRADVCLVMVDATEGLTEQDKRILDYVKENGTAMVLVWTKWDLIEDKKARFKKLDDEIDLKAPFLKYVPSLTVSNVNRQRIYRTFEYVDRVAAEARKRIPTAQLNAFMDKLRATPLPASRRGKVAKIRYATQTSTQPTTFVLFVNQKRLFHFAYLRFIENQLRQEYGFEGIPIRIELREGEPAK